MLVNEDFRGRSDKEVVDFQLSMKKITPPGDKSISHRVLILSALADSPTKIYNLNNGEDVASTIRVLKQLGTQIKIDGDSIVVIPKPFSKPKNRLYCGNSGTTMRLLTGLLSSYPFPVELTGDRSLLNRPMGRVVEPISKMGGNVVCRSDGKGPVKIDCIKQPLNGISYKPTVPSAQVKGAILLAGLNAKGKTVISETVATRDHTELWLRRFGASVEIKGGAIFIVGGCKLHSPGEIRVPSDPSLAAYLAIGALISKKSPLLIQNISLNPRRIGWVEILKKMGAKIETEVVKVDVEPIGNILILGFNKTIKPIDISGNLVPGIIDEIPALAISMLVANGTSRVRGASELKVKESNRISVLVEGLKRVGVNAKSFNDGFSVRGGVVLGGRVSSNGDHRMAMAFGLCNLISKKPMYISEKKSVVVSYPNFFKDLKRINCFVA